jgi:hypothetical protein
MGRWAIGTLVFDEGLWTFSNRQVEQAHRFVLVAALQRQFATEEIDLADMSLLDAGIGIVRGRQYRLHGQPAKIEADDRRQLFMSICLVASSRTLGISLRLLQMSSQSAA